MTLILLRKDTGQQNQQESVVTMNIDDIDVSGLVNRAERSAAPNLELTAEIGEALVALREYNTLEFGGRDMRAVLQLQRIRLSTRQS